MMYALVAPILVFGGGAAIDYGRAAQIHTKLNAAADAAALAALTPSMLQQSTQTAHDASVSMFNGLTEGIPGLTAHAPQVTVTVTVGTTSLIRNVTVSYSSSVNTIFAQVLRTNALPVSGVSEASAEAPPNVDLYVLLDNSPSMALPATAAGITRMESLTAKRLLEGAPSPAIRRIRATTRARRQAARQIQSTILVRTARIQPCQVPRLPSTKLATRIAMPPRATCSSTTMGLRARTTSRSA